MADGILLCLRALSILCSALSSTYCGRLFFMGICSDVVQYLPEIQQVLLKHSQELAKLDLSTVIDVVLLHDVNQALIGQRVAQILEELR